MTQTGKRTFAEQVTEFAASGGPVRFGVVWRWADAMPYVWLHRDGDGASFRGPFKTRGEAEAIARLCYMRRDHEAEKLWKFRDTQKAAEMMLREFHVREFHTPAWGETLEMERQIAVDDRRFPASAEE